MNTEREMTLKEVANQYGRSHRAAKEYESIAVDVLALSNCNWWEFRKKYKLRKRLMDTIDFIEKS